MSINVTKVLANLRIIRVMTAQVYKVKLEYVFFFFKRYCVESSVVLQSLLKFIAEIKLAQSRGNLTSMAAGFMHNRDVTRGWKSIVLHDFLWTSGHFQCQPGGSSGLGPSRLQCFGSWWTPMCASGPRPTLVRRPDSF